ncbi:hypothetical protein PAMA_014431 [Pampus argenteus]
MFKLVLLFLTLSGLQAAPVPDTRGAQKAAFYQLPNGFQHSGIPEAVLDDVRQGIEPSRRFLVDHNTGRMQEHISEMDRRAGFIQPSFENGLEEIDRRYWLTDEVPVDVPAQKNGGGWVRVEEPSAPYLPDGFRQGTERSMAIPDGFRQGTERSMAIPDGFRQGTERSMAIPDGFRQGTERSMAIPDGFRQGTEPMTSASDDLRLRVEPLISMPDGFKQGTEPSVSMPDGFRQGTKRSMAIPDGFRQGTERSMAIPDGFRQGTERSMAIPDGFRQGTEGFMAIPDGFRQGTERFMAIPDGFRQGTEPFMSIPDGFRQGTEPSTSRLQTQTVACKGDIINGNCYEFNPMLLSFQEAQASCRALATNADLASVTSGNLHSRLVSLATNGGKSSPKLTWLGGTVKASFFNQQSTKETTCCCFFYKNMH